MSYGDWIRINQTTNNMKRKLLLVLAVAVATVSTTIKVQAWGGVGHSAIAYIAEKHLTPEAREKCYHYLQHSLAYYASWMDSWRDIDPYKETTYWHTSKVDADNNPLYNESRGAHIHVDRLRKEMKDYKNLSNSAVIINLKLLIHMVGDMHCPSHTGYPDQPGFKGYNIYRSGKATKFHTFWDAAPAYMHKDWTCEDFHERLDKWSKKKIAKVVQGTAEDWARVNGKEMRAVYSLIPIDAEYTKLSEEDRARAVMICETQMLRGAYRLAYVLNEIFEN